MAGPSTIHERIIITANQTAAGRDPITSEKADNYERVLLRLDARNRIVECKDGFQWIVQHNTAKPGNLPRWRWKGFCTTRVGLERCLPQHRGLIARSFPERFTSAYR